MAIAKRLRRQAATCWDLAAITHDEESRERYLRLQKVYLQLADAEEPDSGEAGAYASDTDTEPARHRVG